MAGWVVPKRRSCVLWWVMSSGGRWKSLEINFKFQRFPLRLRVGPLLQEPCINFAKLRVLCGELAFTPRHNDSCQL